MGNGYTRQSAADIQDGEDVIASPLNAEFDALRDAFNQSAGHTHDGTTGEGPKLDLAVSITGVLSPEQGGTGGINKLNATVAPTVTDDGTQGYAVGSLWINTTNRTFFINAGIATGAAVWIGLDADLLALAALSSTGFAVRSAADTWLQRSIVGTAPVTVTNGNGVAGNPTITIADATSELSGLFSSPEKAKLAGIATGATANDTDVNLRARGSHTGEQSIGTITGLQAALNLKLDSTSLPVANAGAAPKTTPIDNDSFVIVDSAASNGQKRVTWLDLKAVIKTYGDTVWAGIVHAHSAATESVAGFMSAADKIKMNLLGSNGYGTRTVSTSAPSGGAHGDIWYQVDA